MGMTDERYLLQIRNGVYALCAVSILASPAAVILNLYLPRQAIET